MKRVCMNRIMFLLFAILAISCGKNEKPVPSVPKIEISVSDISLPDSGTEAGASTSFTITSDTPWSIQLSDTKAVPSWFSVVPQSGNAGTTTVLISVTEENTAYDDRNAYIKITAGNALKVLTITQKKKDALILTKDKIEVGPQGGRFEIEVKSNIDYTIEIPAGASEWISRESKSTKGLETRKEAFTVKQGSTDGPREGMIIFHCGELKDTVSIFQVRRDVLILAEKVQNISNEATQVEVELRSNIEYSVTIPADASAWIKRTGTKAERVDRILFAVSENKAYDRRSAKIIFNDKNSTLADTLTINQSQVNAIILGSNRIEELSCCGETFDVLVKSNIQFTVDIPQEAAQWLNTVQTKGLSESTIRFAVNTNNEYDRSARIIFRGSENTNDTLHIHQDGAKTILMELYHVAGGDNWKDKTNWGSDKPLDTWYGVSTKGVNGELYEINLSGNNLTGRLPSSIGKMKDLERLVLFGNKISDDVGRFIRDLGGCHKLTFLGISQNQFYGGIPSSIADLQGLTGINMSSNHLTGAIPEEICSLPDLTAIVLDYNQLTGKIPGNIGNLSKLKGLYLSNNQLIGAIPEVLGRLEFLNDLALNFNNLSGSIPSSILQRNNWKKGWMGSIIYQNGYTLFPPLEYSQLSDEMAKDINLSEYHTLDLFKKNKYTILFSTAYWCPYSLAYTPEVVDLFEKYKTKGLGVISFQTAYPAELSLIKNYFDQFGMGDFMNLLTITQDPGGGYYLSSPYFAYGHGTPEVMVVDRYGYLKYGLSEDLTQLPDFIKSLLGEPERPYESTDFSKDGEVLTLQQATVGSGINLVFMGDGFIDKDMTSGGKYETRMREAMEHFFSVEPVKSFRNRFNVYCVKAVSLNEGVGNGQRTALSVQFGEGTRVGGDNDKCFAYALNAPSVSSRKNTFIITVINNSRYAGTCYMYGDNASIAYCPIVGFDADRFSQIIHHEAVGHGFGKLADEYSYGGTLPQNEKDSYTGQQGWGWWDNVDFTNNPAVVRWSSFLQNTAYAGQVGIYEGGCTYQYGVWRSTPSSIMLDNIGEFNAPSRYAIYKWIMNLSGESYTMEKFLEYDVINRTMFRSTAVQRTRPAKDFVPLAPPVVIK